MKSQTNLRTPLSKTPLTIRFMKKQLGAPSDTDVEQLKHENEELKTKVTDLEKEVERLEKELQEERANQG